MNHKLLDQLMSSLKKSKYDKVLLDQLKKLSGQNIEAYQFTDVNILIGIEGTNFMDCYFKSTYLNSIDFYSCKFVNCHFEKCSFRKTVFMNTEFINCEISNSDLDSMEFLHGKINQSNFTNCNFGNTDICYTKITSALLNGFFLEKSSDLLLLENIEENLILDIEAVNSEVWSLRSYI